MLPEHISKAKKHNTERKLTMKQYIASTIEITVLSAEDILSASDTIPDYDDLWSGDNTTKDDEL